MPARIQIVPAVLSLGLVILAGCATPPPGKRSAAKRTTATNISAAEAADYSDAAVADRTDAHAHYAAAILHELNDEPGKAAEEFLKAALANPGDEELVLEATSRLLRIRPVGKDDEKPAIMRDKALELLKKATARPEASGTLFARLGLVYSMQGKRELAIEADRQAIKRSPATIAGYQYLAQLYLQNKQIDEGLKVIDEAFKVRGTDAAFLVELGDLCVMYARGGAPEVVRARARDAYRRAAELKPDNPFLLQRMADGLNMLGESDLAAATYSSLLEKFPEAPGVRDRLIELYIRKEDRAKAAEQLRAAVNDAPTNPQAHFLLGSVLLEDKQPKEAEECFKKTILLSPNFEPAYYELALVQINLGQATNAVETLRKARDKFKDTFAGEFYNGVAFGRMKDYSNSLYHLTAAEVIARATATNRLTPSFYFQLGAANERNQRFEEAERCFRKALALSPEFPEAMNYLGYMWAERGQNLKEARSLIEQAVKKEPENSAFLDSLGWVLFKLNEHEDALKWLNKAIEHAEEPDPTLYDHLGDVLAALKQPAKAQEAWKKALSIEPNEIKEQLRKKLDASVTPSSSGISAPR